MNALVRIPTLPFKNIKKQTKKQHLIEKYCWNDYLGMDSHSTTSTATGITRLGKPRPAPIMKASHAFESLLFEFDHDCQSLLLKPKYNRHLRTKGTNAPCDSFFYGAITNPGGHFQHWLKVQQELWIVIPITSI